MTVYWLQCSWYVYIAREFQFMAVICIVSCGFYKHINVLNMLCQPRNFIRVWKEYSKEIFLPHVFFTEVVFDPSGFWSNLVGDNRLYPWHEIWYEVSNAPRVVKGHIHKYPKVGLPRPTHNFEPSLCTIVRNIIQSCGSTPWTLECNQLCILGASNKVVMFGCYSCIQANTWKIGWSIHIPITFHKSHYSSRHYLSLQTLFTVEPSIENNDNIHSIRANIHTNTTHGSSLRQFLFII